MAATNAIGFEAELQLNPDTDDRAPGGAVTVALCGHWDHEGSCRWPHNSRVDRALDRTRLHVVVVTDDASRAEVLERIEGALAHDDRWILVRHHVRPLAADELPLGQRLLASADGSPT